MKSVKRGESSRREDNHMDGHDDGVKVRTRVELEPDVECDENVQGTGLRARAQLVQCYAIGEGALWHCCRPRRH